MSPPTQGPAFDLVELWATNVGSDVTALDVSPDGTLVSVGTLAGKVAGFDAASGEQLAELAEHVGGTTGATWTKATGLLATSGHDGHVRVYDRSGRVTAALHGSSPVEQITWSPDGTTLAIRALSGTRVWRPETRQSTELAPLPKIVNSLAWNRSGSRLAAATSEGLRLFNGTLLNLEQELRSSSSLISLAWSPSEAIIAAGTDDKSVHFWRLVNGRESQILGFSAKSRALAWDATGTLMATSGSATVAVWHFDSGPEGSLPVQLKGHASLCTALAFHPSRTRLASGSDDTTVLVWEPNSRDAAPSVGRLHDTVTCLAWTPDGSTLIGADAAGNVAAWRPA